MGKALVSALVLAHRVSGRSPSCSTSPACASWLPAVPLSWAVEPGVAWWVFRAGGAAMPAALRFLRPAVQDLACPLAGSSDRWG